jgi:hypothetical protein
MIVDVLETTLTELDDYLADDESNSTDLQHSLLNLRGKIEEVLQELEAR